MGFLDNLLKKEARKIISSVVDNVVDSALDSLNGSDKSGEAASAMQTAPVRTASTADTEAPDEQHCCNDAAVVRSRVEKVAANEWSGYELRKNIPANELGADSNARDYSYGLYLNGVPKAMIMILDVPSHYRKKDVLLAHEACEKQNVFCMNLLLHLPNRYSYISKQLADNVAR